MELFPIRYTAGIMSLKKLNGFWTVHVALQEEGQVGYRRLRQSTHKGLTIEEAITAGLAEMERLR